MGTLPITKAFRYDGAMGNAADLRSLDEIVTENALLLLRRRIASRRVERKPYYLNTLAAEMIPFMIPASEREQPGWNRQTAVDRIGHTVARYLGLSKTGKIPWRLDYLEGFYQAMGLSLHEMTAPEIALDDEDRAVLEGVAAYAGWVVPREKPEKRKAYPPPA